MGLPSLVWRAARLIFFGSRTEIETTEEDFFEPIKDFLYEKFVEEKADMMYYIGVAKTVILGVLAGVAIVGGVIVTGASCGAAVPLLAVRFALGELLNSVPFIAGMTIAGRTAEVVAAEEIVRGDSV